MKILLSVLLFSLAAFAEQKLPKDFNSEYDKFKDETTITRKSSYIKGKSSSQMVAALVFKPYLVFSGKELSSNATSFYFSFTSKSMFCRGRCFVRSHGLIILADDKRLDLGDGHWDSAGDTDEIMVYTVDRQQLEKMVAAAKVEFQIGSFEATFANNDRASIKNILELGSVKK